MVAAVNLQQRHFTQRAEQTATTSVANLGKLLEELTQRKTPWNRTVRRALGL
jgi:hypothetical protein